MRGFLTILTVIFCALRLQAQDIHFSQFFASPLTTNPAQTGFYQDDWRVGLNFRNQWGWGSAQRNYTYRTYSGYGDLSVLPGVLPAKDKLAIGGNLLYDKAGDGDLSATKAHLAAAYHKSLDKEGRLMVSVGLSGGIIHRRIDFTKLTFDNQWNEAFFDLGLGNGEATGVESFMFSDINAGMILSARLGVGATIYAGSGFYHINRGEEKFLREENRLGVRPMLNAGGEFTVKNNLILRPSLLYVSQKRASEVVGGALAGYLIDGSKPQQNIFFAGAFIRWNDAIVPVAGYQVNNLRMLISYDINISSLKKASSGRGGLELSLVYSGRYGRDRGKFNDVPCPRFF